MKTVLGKGLDALISDETAASVEAAPGKSADVSTIPLDRIRPNPQQPRKVYKQEALVELTASIAQRGVLQPILVSASSDGSYEIIAGERRWRAAKRAGLTEIPAIIKTAPDVERFQMSLIENIQREDLNPLEQANGFVRLINEFHMTQVDIAAIIGKDRTVVANTVRLLNLPSEMRQALFEGKITASHARALVAMEDPTAQVSLFKRILEDDLSVRSVESAVRAHKQIAVKGHVRSAAGQAKSSETKALEEDLQRVLARKVELQPAGPTSKKGWIKLEFYSLDDLDHLVAQLKRTAQPS